MIGSPSVRLILPDQAWAIPQMQAKRATRWLQAALSARCTIEICFLHPHVLPKWFWDKMATYVLNPERWFKYVCQIYIQVAGVGVGHRQHREVPGSTIGGGGAVADFLRRRRSTYIDRYCDCRWPWMVFTAPARLTLTLTLTLDLFQQRLPPTETNVSSDSTLEVLGPSGERNTVHASR